MPRGVAQEIRTILIMTIVNPEDPLDPGDPGDPDNPDPEDPTGPLQPPYGITLVPGADGGWSITVGWNYSFRYSELSSFSVSRLKRGDTEWIVVKDDIRNSVRTFDDMLPDEAEYTYTVTAYPADGSPPLVADPPVDAAGHTIYVQADASTTIPQNIRKPLRSTKEKMFIAWNYHSAASSYTLEAVDANGDAYYTVRVTDVFSPYGLFVGPHPADMMTARVTIMRRRTDGTEYAASSAQEDFFVDDIADPHFAVVDIAGQDSTTLLNRNLAYSVVMALAEYGEGDVFLTVNNVSYPQEIWRDHGGHKSATIEACYPAGSAVMASMVVSAPDNLQDEEGS